MKLISKKLAENEIEFKDVKPGEKFWFMYQETIYTKVVVDQAQFKGNEMTKKGLAMRGDSGVVCVFTGEHSLDEIVHLVTPRNTFSATIEVTSEAEFKELQKHFTLQ